MSSWSFSLGYFLTVFAFGYLLGSIPFGLLTTRFAGLGDVRSIGSGNIGATNVLRTGRKGLAALTLLGDALKGTLAVILVRLHGGDALGNQPEMVAALGAFSGHIFPIWLGFKGGKGVATYLGLVLGLFWPAAFIFAAVWIAAAWFSRYSSLGGLSATASVPLTLWAFGLTDIALLFLVLATMVWIKHHANIRRLLNGTESRIGSKK